MVKHTRTVRRQKADELFSVFDHFVGLALKRLNEERRSMNNRGNTKVGEGVVTNNVNYSRCAYFAKGITASSRTIFEITHIRGVSLKIAPRISEMFRKTNERVRIRG